MNANDTPPDPAAVFQDSFGQFWSTTVELWTAWGEAWHSVYNSRAVPALGAVMDRVANPATWPDALAPLREELEQFLLLPKLADVPTFEPPWAALMPAAELAAATPSYIASLLPVWAKVGERFRTALAEERGRGEQVESAGQILEIWNAVLDRTLMEFTRSSEFGKNQQRFLRARAHHRLEVRKAANRAAGALDLPTRSELEDIYQRLHDLRQEVYELRQQVRMLKQAPTIDEAPG